MSEEKDLLIDEISSASCWFSFGMHLILGDWKA